MSALLHLVNIDRAEYQPPCLPLLLSALPTALTPTITSLASSLPAECALPSPMPSSTTRQDVSYSEWNAILDSQLHKLTAIIAVCSPELSRVCWISTSSASVPLLPLPVSSTHSAVNSSARCRSNLQDWYWFIQLTIYPQVLGYQRNPPSCLPGHRKGHGQAPRR